MMEHARGPVDPWVAPPPPPKYHERVPRPRTVQTFRVSRDLLRRAAKLDGLRPAEWVRLIIERAARERVAQADQEEARARIRRRIDAEDFEDEKPAEAAKYNHLRHGGR